MPATSRIPHDLARAVCVFLEQATKWDGMILAGMLARGVAELEGGREFRMVTWEKLTAQKVADALWTLKEQKGDELKAHGITLRHAIAAWDEIILRTRSYDRPVLDLRNKST
jgi:hypothetical protein